MRTLKCIWFFVIGNILCLYKYEKKYTKGELFAGRFRGIKSGGWEMLVKDYFGCKKLGINKGLKWPVSPSTIVVGYKNIHFNPNDLRIFQTPGCYFQGIGNIFIGTGCFIAPNVGIITSNHNFSDLFAHDSPKDVFIGDNCWIGMNSVVLPGVTLGNKTIVGAGSVVTHSFPDGNCVIAGNPAKIIKLI